MVKLETQPLVIKEQDEIMYSHVKGQIPDIPIQTKLNLGIYQMSLSKKLNRPFSNLLKRLEEELARSSLLTYRFSDSAQYDLCGSSRLLFDF